MPNGLSRKLLSIFFAMVMFSMAFQNVATAHILFTIEDSGSSIILNSDDAFTISLVDHPSTGYSWNISSTNSKILKLINQEFWEPTDVIVPGETEFHNWTFEGAEKGTTTLKFVYWRPWEGNESIIYTFTLNVTSNVSKTTNTLLIITVFSLIVVVPSAVIIKRMKGEEKNEQ